MYLDLHSEAFAPSGGIDGRAARRAMGKPDMAFWELFLRETLQNSWDARLAERIGFSVSAQMLDVHQSSVLESQVLADVPPALEEFKAGLGSRRVHVLVVADSGTRGLGGMTRANVAPAPGESTDFVDFIRNMGRASTKALGGGTYGFGKGVLYDASRVNTCLIYSQTKFRGQLVHRFIVASVAEQYEFKNGRFTGRHWWGARDQDGVVDPVTGEAARALAETLGLALMGRHATGTTIAVLDPVLDEDESLEPIVSKIAQAATDWAWPHMVDSGAGPSIDFSFNAYGAKVSLEDLSGHPVLQHFVRAYEKAVDLRGEESDQQQWPWTTRAIDMQRPKKHLGLLTYRKYMIPDDAAGLERRNHIALMRGPRFIVKYLEVPQDPGGQGTAGVFISSDDANDDFARAEPAAHDEWVPDSLTGSRVNPVRIALNRIKDEFKHQAIGRAGGRGDDNPTGVAQVSRILGSIISGTAGQGAEIQKRTTTSKGGGSTRSHIGVVIDSHPELRASDGVVVADFGFSVQSGPRIDRSEYVLDAAARVVLDGGAVEGEDQRPVGGDEPEVVGWISDGDLVSEEVSISVDRLTGTSLALRVKQPRHVAVTAVIMARRLS